MPQKKSKEKNQIEKNQIINNIDFFENIFKEIKITFTKTNRASVERLLKTMSIKEVELYLKETYQAIKEVPEVKSVARLFSSKIAKGERQLVTTKQIKKETLKSSTSEKKDLIIPIVSTPKEENIQKEFQNLSEYEQLKIEEKAILMCIKEENIQEKFLLDMKKFNQVFYYAFLNKYIKNILKEKNS